MGDYGSSLNSGSAYGRSNFYDSLITCLDSAKSSVAKLAILNLATAEVPDPEHRNRPDTWASDSLLVYDGKPLAAVEIRVEGSHANRTLREVAAIQAFHFSNASRAVQEVKKDVTNRLRAAVKSVEEEKEAAAAVAVQPKRVMTELAWRITVRTPGTKVTDSPAGPVTDPDSEHVFSGSPFDFDKIEQAFDLITTIIETAIKGA